MRVVTSLNEIAGPVPVAMAIGTFDGMHRGHQAVVGMVKRLAARHGASAAVFFFSPLPREVLQAGNPPRRLTSDEEKLEIMSQLGVDLAVKVRFDRALSALSAEAFFNRHILDSGTRVVALCVGDQWRFGCRNAGDAGLLRRLSQPRGIEVETLPEVEYLGRPVSSTRIRECISRGDLAEAGAMLGRPYAISGEVCTGNGIASGTLHCPTANITDDRKQLPPYGVYAALTRCGHSGQSLPGIVYIGNAPTFRDDGRALVEVHLFDFKCDIYGRHIVVEPVKFLRPSRKFDSPEALRAQIARDIDDARAALAQ